MKLHDQPTLRCSAVILTVCLLGFLKPPVTSWQPVLSALFNGLRLVSIALTVVYAILCRTKLSAFTWALAAHRLLLVLVTLLRGGNTAQALVGAATVVAEMVLFETAIKRNLADFLKVACCILTAYVVINFLTVVFIRQGLYRTVNGSPVFFLGMHNRFVFWMLPLLCMSCLRAYLRVGHLTWHQYGLHGLCLLTLLIEGAVGAAIGLLILLVFFLVEKGKIALMDYRVYLLVFFVLWAALTFTDFLELFSWFTEGILGKGGNLAARLSLWQRGKDYLAESPGHFLFGYGLEADAVIEAKFWYVHLHNDLLNTMYQTGFVGLMIYMLAFGMLIGPMVRNKHHPAGKLLAMTLFAFFVMMLMDTYDLYGHYYAVAVLAANADRLAARCDRTGAGRRAGLRLVA